MHTYCVCRPVLMTLKRQLQRQTALKWCFWKKCIVLRYLLITYCFVNKTFCCSIRLSVLTWYTLVSIFVLVKLMSTTAGSVSKWIGSLEQIRVLIHLKTFSLPLCFETMIQKATHSVCQWLSVKPSDTFIVPYLDMLLYALRYVTWQRHHSVFWFR